MDTTDTTGTWAGFPDPEAWAGLGVPVMVATHWYQAGVAVASVRAYLAEGMTLRDVRDWREPRTYVFPSSASVIAWHRTGLGAGRARVWRDLQVSPAAAARYHARGWDVHINPATDDTTIYRWITGMALDEADWEDWLRIKATPPVVRLAHASGLTPADLTAMVRLINDPEVLTLAIRAGYDAAELELLDLASPDAFTTLTVAAALNANDDVQVA
jgi:hypothetical protein